MQSHHRKPGGNREKGENENYITVHVRLLCRSKRHADVKFGLADAYDRRSGWLWAPGLSAFVFPHGKRYRQAGGRTIIFHEGAPESASGA